MLVKEDGTQVGWIQFGNQPSGSYSWDPAKVRYSYNVDVPDGKYKIRAIDYNDPRGTAVAYDVSDAAFKIVAAGTPSITVLSPNGGESWQIDSTQLIKWSAPSTISTVDIYLTFELDPRLMTIMIKPIPLYIVRQTPNDGVFEWKVGSFEGGNLPLGKYRLTIAAQSTSDSSDAAFSIVPASVSQ